MTKIKAAPIQQEKSRPILLSVILAAGFLFRLLYLYCSQESPFFEPLLLDPAYYHEWAKRIAAGNLIDPPVFYGLPLYPFFLALCYKIFSGSLIAVKLVQALLGVVTLFLIYKIGGKLFSKNTGLLASAMAAGYAPYFFNEQIFIAEALAIPLYAASFYLVCLFEERPTAKRGVWLGVCLGLAVLTKANALLFAGLYLVAWILRRREMKPAVVCLAALLATLTPVAAHNFIYGKDTVLLSSHAGFNFYAGNNPRSEGVFAAPEGTGTNVEAQREDSRRLAETALGRPLKPSEVSNYWSDRAMEFILNNPGKFLELCGRKILLFFDAREISDLEDIEFSKIFIPFLNFPWATFAALGPLFLLGFVLSFGKVRQGFLAYGWIAAYLAGLAAFFVNARYRLPILSVFFPFAAFGLTAVYLAFKNSAWGRVALAGVILAGGVWVSRLNLVGVDPSTFFVNAGDAYALQNEPEKARELYKHAVEINPDNPKAKLAMGLSLSKSHRPEEAEKYYREAIAADPTNPQAYNNLGLWYEKQGKSEEAEALFLKAVEVKPTAFQAYNNLGMLYGNRRDHEKALRMLEKALELNPQSPRAHTNLGLILYRLGRKEEALAEWKKALEIDPNFELAQRAIGLYEGKS